MHYWIGNIVLLFVYKLVLDTARIKKYRKNSILLYLMLSQLLFLYVFKDNYIFHDIWSYLIGFEYSKTIEWGQLYRISSNATYLNYELGWRYYVKALSSIYSNEMFFIFVCGFIILMSHFKLIKKYSSAPWLSIFLFIALPFYNSLLLIRQYIAVAICLFAIPYIIDKKLVKFIVTVLIATMFHYTSVVFLLLYYVNFKELRMKQLFLYLGGILITVTLSSTIINIFIKIFPKYEVYLLFDILSTNLTNLFISLVVIGFVLTTYPIKNHKPYDRLFLIMILISVLIDIARLGFPSTITRLNIFFSIGFIILIPNAISTIKIPFVKYLSIVSITVLYLLLMFNQMQYGFELIF